MTCNSCGAIAEHGTKCATCGERTDVRSSELRERFGPGFDVPYATRRLFFALGKPAAIGGWVLAVLTGLAQ